MIIEARDLRMIIDGREIVPSTDLTCEPGQMSALVGPSGSGKTTLLHCLGLLQVPTSGQVVLDGQDATGLRSSARRRFWARHAAFVLQDYGVMDEESVSFNVTMASTVLGRRAAGSRERLSSALEVTGLAGRETELAAHLSGGEKQRLGVARAVYKDARCIFVDEPTASLDDDNRAMVIELFAARAREGRTLVVATHDRAMIEACDVRYSLARGDGGDDTRAGHEPLRREDGNLSTNR